MKLNRNQLKYIGAVAMLADHIGMCFFPVATPIGFILRTLGRLTAPIMFTLFAEGFTHTKSKKAYGLRLFVFALISQIPYSLIRGTAFYRPNYNVIATFFLCFIMLLAYDNIKNSLMKFLSIICIMFLGNFFDWGIVGPMWTLAAYGLPTKKKRIAGFLIVCAYHIINQFVTCFDKGYHIASAICQAGVVLFVPLYLLYNSQKGSSSKFSKWFFYIFYPLHLLVLYFVAF